mgnify:CR=1 FL=1
MVWKPCTIHFHESAMISSHSATDHWHGSVTLVAQIKFIPHPWDKMWRLTYRIRNISVELSFSSSVSLIERELWWLGTIQVERMYTVFDPSSHWVENSSSHQLSYVVDTCLVPSHLCSFRVTSPLFLAHSATDQYRLWKLTVLLHTSFVCHELNLNFEYLEQIKWNELCTVSRLI